MNPYVVLAATAAAWHRLADRLTGSPRDTLTALLAVVRRRGVPETERRAAAEEAAALLLRQLPEEFDAGPDGRLAGGLVDVAPDTEPHPAYQGFSAEDLAVLLTDGHRMVGPVLGPVRERLLAAPAWDAEALTRLGGDPGLPGLIRLPGAGGRPRLPRFQFTGAGAARPVVIEVNTHLAADRDPWGAADWWLSDNAWLGARPARLLDTGRDRRLADTARLLMEEG
ncbi:hypothetical protein [Streptomyces flavofungini]|uniref:Uncharacterized protein n=1 Tax=Streptomyces flavofungini TaxID=68200 RepID=A0ABS0X6H5_9ACTN|nr:hypothetical protein [Streptomyces flavofungini]MBJ3808811.1 hypothetical protein [Streptomyces flavofungini]GHC49146.1 hypothetical protein GCM10010349_13270 [Streptomyces flavofungini]